MKTLTTRPSSRTPGCAAIVEFLERIWPLTARHAELSYVFVQADPRTTATCTARQRATHALRNLVNTGTLECVGDFADRQWNFKKPTTSPVVQPVSDAAEYCGTPAEPRRDGCSAVYQPKLWPINRAGAQDFKGAPSVGQRC